MRKASGESFLCAKADDEIKRKRTRSFISPLCRLGPGLINLKKDQLGAILPESGKGVEDTSGIRSIKESDVWHGRKIFMAQKWNLRGLAADAFSGEIFFEALKVGKKVDSAARGREAQVEILLGEKAGGEVISDSLKFSGMESVEPAKDFSMSERESFQLSLTQMQIHEFSKV